MLKYIKIKGVESHKDSCYEFSPNVNLIVGVSNSGKSSVIRSICICAFNRWDEDMLNGRIAEVEVGSDKGIVSVRKGKNINEWSVLDYSDGKKYEYQKIGKTVPDMVVKVLGMPEIEWNDITETPNVMFQLDKHYLIAEIDGKKCTSNMFARVVDNVLGLGGAEELIKEISTDGASNKRKYNSNIEFVEQLKTKLNDEKNIADKKELLVFMKQVRDKVILLDELKKTFCVVENKTKSLKDIKESVEKMNGLDVAIETIKKVSVVLNKYIIVKDLLVKYDVLLKSKKDGECALLNFDKFENIIESCKSLVKKNENYLGYKKNYELNKTINDNMKNIASKMKFIPEHIDLSDCENKSLMILELQNIAKIWEQKRGDNNDCDLKIKKYNVSYDKSKIEYETIKKEIGLCPLCDKPFGEEHGKHTE